ncbi:hypothetical protein LD907_14745 [Salmonella enterica]|uniref:hypothetical protein n=1 Tax=Salmonella enterica TaxID=28901 RepID=UPI0020CDD697|nr:hypothetical protein [Salmonella enterica]MDJ3705966.1 hypothetical protein [Salmonella enterica]MDJ5019103.1 hypothetical protein [Salmonella enterica]MDJ5132855.1 hypothetical protein [Salmonella enterica]MDJ6527975.1 hypothetical protein [Salmonella enterica]MDJ8417705.1 hypothetical protein [Salmonella enterica]
MTDTQLAAFQAASLSKPETVSLLVLGLFTSVLLLCVVRLDAAGRLAGRLPPALELAELWCGSGPFTITGAGQLLASTELRRHHALASVTAVRHI